MTKLKTLSILLALTMTSACSMIPEYFRPAAPVPATIADADVNSQDAAANLDSMPWREYFADAQLRDVIALALENNRDLRVSALNIEKARAQYNIQRAGLFPDIGLTGSENAQRYIFDVFPTHQYNASVGFTAYELDFFGRIRSLKAQALELYLGTEEAKRSAHISLVAEVSNAWLILAAERERLNLARSTYDTRLKSLDLTRRSLEVGVGSALELRQAETLMQTSRADVARFTTLVAQDENALTLIAGAPVPASMLPDALTSKVSALTEIPAGVSSEILTRRPDILQAERALRATNASIGAARAAFFPTISLTSSAGIASLRLGELFEGGSNVWTFMPQIRLPIFDGGRLKATLESTKVQRDINIAQYEKAIQSAFREVADAFAERATLDEQLDARRKLVEASEGSFRLSEARYKEGVDSYLGLLDSQRALYLAEQELINIRLVESTNRVALYKVLGGGWK
jgi:multidrug efflux system outer membrane protein